MRLHPRRSLAIGLLAMALAGCPAAPGTAPASQQDSATVDQADQTAPQLRPPRPDSVLYFISDVDGDGATRYEIQNGSTIHFWHGLQFNTANTRYYTGFAWITPEKYGADRASGHVDPDAPVVLAHATFVAGPADGTTPWTLDGSEPWIGTFGQAERGNPVDPTRTTQTWTGPDDRVVIAVPTHLATAASAAAPAFEILTFSPHPPADARTLRWQHLGTLPVQAAAGADTTLAFDAPGEAGLPDIRLTTHEVADGGDNAVQYRYDPAHNTYRPTSR